MGFPTKFRIKSCPACTIPIEKGERIVYVKGEKVIHESCVPIYEKLLTTLKSPLDNPTEPQEKIRVAFEKGLQNIQVIAGPGTGKTTTAEYAVVSQLQKDSKTRMLMLAFNSSIVEELERRIHPLLADLHTFHRFGNRLCWKKFKPAWGNPEDKLIKLFIAKMCPNINSLPQAQRDKQFARFFVYKDLIDHAKNHCLTPGSIENHIQEFSRKFGIDIPNLNVDRQFVSELKKLFQLSIKDVKHIDFSDMLYFLKHYNITLPTYDKVVVDEAQDMNELRRWLVFALAAKGAQIMYIGDPKQAIYPWAGADIRSMSMLQTHLKPIPLELMICWRIQNLHILEYARKLNDGLIPSAQADYMEPVDHIISDRMFEDVCPGDVVLSRVNSILVDSCIRLRRKGIPAMILGKDVGDGLTDLLKKFSEHASTVEDVLSNASEWRLVQFDKYKDNPVRIAKVDDQFDSLRSICDKCETIGKVQKRIDILFGENSQAESVVHSTPYKFKGREADRVYHITHKTTFHNGQGGWKTQKMYPHPLVKDHADLIQGEYCADFVARSRAKYFMNTVDYVMA